MRSLFLSSFISILFFGCQDSRSIQKLKQGEWRATLLVAENEQLPFTFGLEQTAEGYQMKIKNADEIVLVDEIEFDNDSIFIQMPVFEGYIAGTFTENHIEGQFIKESLERFVPFEANQDDGPRFETTTPAKVDISGIWEVQFDFDKAEDAYPAKGIFNQKENVVTGTFRTKTGDYRYLEGVVEGHLLKLSTFDGAHAFLFTAEVSDSTMIGKFYSGNHSIENFVAQRNASYELPDADSLTFLKEGYDKFDFSFPNKDGETISLTDSRFDDKVVLVQIMGTWCPNCLDETRYYVEYLKNNPNENLEVIALAFEYAKSPEKAWAGIERLIKREAIPYPIVLAQYGSSDKEEANQKLPMLNHVLSYPTTIYIDKQGAVRKIHTGFNGPATGEKYEEFKKEFEQTLNELLSE